MQSIVKSTSGNTYRNVNSMRTHKAVLRSDERKKPMSNVINKIKTIAGYNVVIENNEVSFTINKTQKASLRRSCQKMNLMGKQFSKKANMKFDPISEDDFIREELQEILDDFTSNRTDCNLTFGGFAFANGKAKLNKAQQGLLNVITDYAKAKDTENVVMMDGKFYFLVGENWKELSLSYTIRKDDQQGLSQSEMQKKVNKMINKFLSKVDLEEVKTETKNVINQ